MRETELIADHRKKWLEKSPGAFYHKIEDTLGLGKKKPFDVFILDSGKNYAIEFKLHKLHTAFPLANIQPHQLEGLRRAKANGAHATVFIGVRCLLDIDQKERLKLRVRRIAFDLEYELQEIVDLLDQGVKGIDILSKIKESYGTS